MGKRDENFIIFFAGFAILYGIVYGLYSFVSKYMNSESSDWTGFDKLGYYLYVLLQYFLYILLFLFILRNNEFLLTVIISAMV